MADKDQSKNIMAVDILDDKLDSKHMEEAAGDVDNKTYSSVAMAAEEAERLIPLFAALKVYRSAILWSMAISLVIVMDGYDTGREL